MRIKPPSPVHEPVSVFIADYGPHASLILPDGDEAAVEFAFGEWRWFALNHDQWYDAIPILLGPRPATLASRRITCTPTLELLRGQVSSQEMFALKVERSAVEKLRNELTGEFEARADERIFNEQTGLWCAPCKRPYKATHNCNTAVAGWLEELGCEVHGPRLWAHFEVCRRQD